MQLLNFNSVNILDQYINWMIFFELFSVKNFTSSMIFGDNISNYLQSKKSNSNNFIYFSTSGNLLDNKKISKSLMNIFNFPFLNMIIFMK